MSALGLLLISFAAGAWLAHRGQLCAESARALNAILLNVCLPALMLSQVHAMPLDVGLLLPIGVGWSLLVLAIGVFAVLARWTGIDRATTGTLILTAGAASSTFMGLPMIEAFFGRAQVGPAAVTGVFGSIIALSTLGVLVAAWHAEARVDWRRMLRAALGSPPVLAVVCAFALRPVSFGAAFEEVLARLGDLMTPLVMLSAGAQLAHGKLKVPAAMRRPLAIGLGFKLIAGPVVVLLLATAVVGAVGSATPGLQLALFQSTMAPNTVGAALVSQYRLNPVLATLMLAIGMPVSFLTSPVWAMVLGAPGHT